MAVTSLGALLTAGRLVAGATSSDADAAQRCAVRLSIALTGASPSAALLAGPTPALIDSLIASPEFTERFARFVNATYNDQPGAKPSEDASYFLARELISKKLPWKNMFIGQYNVDVPAGSDPTDEGVRVTADPNGLGYFRSQPWLIRYAGNELAGLKITTAYRIMHNVIGLRLTAVTSAPNVDTSDKGRRASPCNQCHVDNAFALDKVASILSTRVNTDGETTFGPQPAAQAVVLGGKAISDDKSLVQTLVDSDSFKFASCRLAFQYLYGRPENTCEAALFDQCVAAFAQTGTMQAAVKTIVSDPSFCQ